MLWTHHSQHEKRHNKKSQPCWWLLRTRHSQRIRNKKERKRKEREIKPVKKKKKEIKPVGGF
jgi:hypothetical protein